MLLPPTRLARRLRDPRELRVHRDADPAGVPVRDGHRLLPVVRSCRRARWTARWRPLRRAAGSRRSTVCREPCRRPGRVLLGLPVRAAAGARRDVLQPAAPQAAAGAHPAAARSLRESLRPDHLARLHRRRRQFLHPRLGRSRRPAATRRLVSDYEGFSVDRTASPRWPSASPSPACSRRCATTRAAAAYSSTVCCATRGRSRHAADERLVFEWVTVVGATRAVRRSSPSPSTPPT